MGGNHRAPRNSRAGQCEQSLAGLRKGHRLGADIHQGKAGRRRAASGHGAVHRRGADADPALCRGGPGAGHGRAGGRAGARASTARADVPRGAAEPAHSALRHVVRGRLSQHAGPLRSVHVSLSAGRSGGGTGDGGERLRAAGGLFPQLQPRQRSLSRHAAGRQRPEHRAGRHDPGRARRLQRAQRDVPARLGGAAAHRPEDQSAREPRNAAGGLRAGHAAHPAGAGLSPV